MARPASASTRAQATVELALVMPVLLGLALLGVQLGLVVRDHLMVVNAAREGARAAAVDPSPARAREAAMRSGALDPERTSVSMATADGAVTVSVRYRSRTLVPLIGPLLPDIELAEHTTMRIESPP